MVDVEETLALSETFKAVKEASRKLMLLSEASVNDVLLSLADETENHISEILAENKKDLDRMDMADPKYDRLLLSEDRLKDIARDLRKVAQLPSPLNTLLEKKQMENGLIIEKVSVPLGVIGIIYEARPNVTFDVFALCLKSGNACILKGGSDAEYSNTFTVGLIRKVLENNGLNSNIVTLLPSDRSATHELLHATEYVDIIIPRGSQGLIDYVRDHSKVPVIETGAGIVHTYFDKTGDLSSGAEIIYNAKTRRVSVCNALDCLIIHKERLSDLPALVSLLKNKNVQLFADPESYAVLKGKYPAELIFRAEKIHFGTEFLDYKMSIKTVSGLEDALDHIALYSSKHSEAIISEDQSTIDLFLKSVDAASVYANASTAFTDGGQFGLGAEIGISTQKLHARGPMALQEMTSYKWIIHGKGNVRMP